MIIIIILKVNKGNADIIIRKGLAECKLWVGTESKIAVLGAYGFRTVSIALGGTFNLNVIDISSHKTTTVLAATSHSSMLGVSA